MQFKDLKTQYEFLKEEIDAEIRSVLSDGSFILGSKVEELEDKLAAYVGRKYCVTCGSGTDALTLALMTLGVGPGDAVFVPDFTFIAPAGTVSRLGAVPVFTDIDPRTFNMDPVSLTEEIEQVLKEGKLTPKAVIPVDLFGLPADYDRILQIAKKYSLSVLEDGAQGFGGSTDGKKACSFGDISVTSFFPAKPLGCYGDGGAVFTDDAETAALLLSLRAHGRSPADKYAYERLGLNSRLDTLQAAILLPKLAAFEKYELTELDRVAARYTERLRDAVTVPFVPDGSASAWAQYTILLRDEAERAFVQTQLKEKEIPSMIYYPKGLHAQAAYAAMDIPDSRYPNTCDIAKRCLSLPIHPYLREEDAERIIGILLHSVGEQHT